MKLYIEDIWPRALALLKDEVTSTSFDTWFKPMRPIEIRDNMLCIEVPNVYIRNMLKTRYSMLVTSACAQVSGGQQLELVLYLPGEWKPEGPDTPGGAENDNIQLLNPKYTFDSFVVGSSNRMAHAAALAVAESPDSSYRPLFLYGGVGLGKTHLMHAIGHRIIKQKPESKVLYISSESFTNDLITAIQNNNQMEFRNRYRNVDILLIDDIQFIAGKVSTQEEFFHTFNTLYEADKQIVISSDKPPKEIALLEERLCSRFQMGFVAYFQIPDYETRVAILRKKTDMENINVDAETMEFIAQRIQSNNRELEGALRQVISFARLSNQPITLDLAQEALKDILANQELKVITPKMITDVVGAYFNLKPEDFTSKRRDAAVAVPRQYAMFLTRELVGVSLPKIGEMYGGRDHSTVIYAIDKISNGIGSDLAVRHTYNELRRKLMEE